MNETGQQKQLGGDCHIPPSHDELIDAIVAEVPFRRPLDGESIPRPEAGGRLAPCVFVGMNDMRESRSNLMEFCPPRRKHLECQAPSGECEHIVLQIVEGASGWFGVEPSKPAAEFVLSLEVGDPHMNAIGNLEELSEVTANSVGKEGTPTLETHVRG